MPDPEEEKKIFTDEKKEKIIDPFYKIKQSNTKNFAAQIGEFLEEIEIELEKEKEE